MQAVIRPTSGISDEQSRKTSPVQSRRWSSCVKAWLADGNIARQKARLEMILKFRTFIRSMRIVAPKSRPTFTAIRQAIRRLGINHDCIEASADASSLLNNCAPEFSIGGCISSVLLFHDGTLPRCIRWRDRWHFSHIARCPTLARGRRQRRDRIDDGPGLIFVAEVCSHSEKSRTVMQQRSA
jgi:hypothetical protein